MIAWASRVSLKVTGALAIAVLMSYASPSSFAQDATDDAPAPPSVPEFSQITTEQVPLNLEDRSRVKVGKLTYLGGLRLKSTDTRLGGLSSLVVSADGSRLLAVSDCGLWVGASLNYTQGRLTGVEDLIISPLLDTKGKSLAYCDGDKAAGDAESLTELPGIGYVVGFENNHRLMIYNVTMDDFMTGKPARSLPLPVDVINEIRALKANNGIESLTTLRDHKTIIAIAEDNPKGGDLVPGWIIGETQIARFSYVASDGFRASDMTTLPDGDLLILERRLTLLQGLGARIKRVRQEDLQNGKIVHGEEVAMLSYPFYIDNMEGISARLGPDGRPIIYLLSDDNYFPLQRTILMMFRLDH